MPKQLTGAEIRQSFLNHFAERGHVVVPSSSLVPDNDPTLMFTNSGMVQFKNNFTGVDTRLKRAVSSQRCVRAGGKHNDLENVGYTARHHTFFEMLGNFSFGDYFKEESITWGWQWVTEVLGLDPARICVTVYHDDDEAFDIWNKKVGLAKEDIIRIATDDNFWTMGDTGPCGPCSEIFYDLDPSGKHVWGGRPGTPEEDGDRWMEIWNHVFTQFDLQKDGSKVPLKNKNIDTGAGLERVMCAVQGVYSNYDTDLFQQLIQPASKMVGVEYGKAEGSDASLRVIADHLRAMSFLMTDGVMPSNEGRGYVLRRIMRRAMRHGFLLGMDKPFIHGLVPNLVHAMGEAYPELTRAAPMVADVVKMEEERFGKTLKQGMALLDEEASKVEEETKSDIKKMIENEDFLKHSLNQIKSHVDSSEIQKALSDFREHSDEYSKMINDHTISLELSKAISAFYEANQLLGDFLKDYTEIKNILSGKSAFKLYDTYGFPVDLTSDALKSRCMGLDMESFNKEMEAQRERARAAHKGSGDAKLSDVWFDVQDSAGPTEFLGYKVLAAEAVVQALVKDATQVETLKAGESGFLVVGQSPFYAESGGQVGDTGTVSGEGWKGTITDTQKVLDGVWIHALDVTEGTVKVGTPVELKVDAERRNAIMRNHSATHLLFAGLRELLGQHVVQRGSRQDDHTTRFDISHPKAVTPEELAKIEAWVNERIWRNLPVVTRILPVEDAKESGAMAQFGEKYGDEVRVVYMGTPDSNLMVTADLCGGTHVSQTGEIGLFRITSESSVAAGIRRIEGITHMAALDSFKADADTLKETAGLLKTKAAEVPARVKELQAKGKQAAKAAAPKLDIAALFAKAEDVKGIKAVFADVGDAAPEQLRDAAEQLKNRLQSGVVVLIGNADGKASLVAGVTKDLTDKVQAGPLVNAAAGVLGGKGGGRPELAMAGGMPGDSLKALEAAKGAL